MLMEDVHNEEGGGWVTIQGKRPGSVRDFLMGDSGESDYGSSKKKRKKMVKKHKPERKEEKMLKPRL